MINIEYEYDMMLHYNKKAKVPISSNLPIHGTLCFSVGSIGCVLYLAKYPWWLCEPRTQYSSLCIRISQVAYKMSKQKKCMLNYDDIIT